MNIKKAKPTNTQAENQQYLATLTLVLYSLDTFLDKAANKNTIPNMTVNIVIINKIQQKTLNTYLECLANLAESIRSSSQALLQDSLLAREIFLIANKFTVF